MLKLFSLEGFLSLSSDAVKKIETVLKKFGLDKTVKFDDVDDFIDAAAESIDEGATVILAAENEEYNSVKKQIIDNFSLRSSQNEAVRSRIVNFGKGNASGAESDAHCLLPLDADIYVTSDGLFSGFCVEFSNGARMILLPLDYARLDDILVCVKKELDPGAADTELEYNDAAFADEAADPEEKSEEKPLAETPEETPEDIPEELPEEFTAKKAASPSPFEEAEQPFGEAFSGAEDSSHTQDEEASIFGDETEEDEEIVLTLKNGEELIIDDSADEADLTGFDDAIAGAAKAVYSLVNLDKRVAFVGAETSPFLHAMCEKVDGLSDTFKVCEIELENEGQLEAQVALAKKTRIAINDTGADFGAAISSVTKEEKDGKEFYYAYIIIHDGTSAKAKKVSTSTRQGVQSLIPHAFSVMFGLIERKAESIAVLENDIPDEDDKDKKKKTLMLVASVAAATVAIVSAVVMVWSYFQRTPEILTTDPPTQNSTVSFPSSTSSTTEFPMSSTQASTSAIPGLTPTDPSFPYPAEPTASDISVTPTSTPFSSTKGVFTFTVYGYGHGVGMSQTGANYYAGLGKTYLEILAMYYYGASLVIGDTTPETVKYGSNSYTLRDYLATAVESEMGGSYNKEALKAQAVAVYTFAKYNKFEVPQTLHAFNKTPTQASYDAVDAVIGQYMVYNGKVAKPYFHATSAGKTTSYTNVFGDEQIPYLAGGRPSYGDVNVKDYCTTVTFSSEELSALIYSKTGKQLTGDPANWFKIMSHDGCVSENVGYVSKIQVGDQIYSGYDFRIKVLGGAIRSHCFSFIYTPTT